MRVCVSSFLLKIINTGVAPGRPAAYSAWLSTMLQKWSHSPIHPSIPPFSHPSFSSSVPQERTPWPFKQATISSDQTRVGPDTPHPPQNHLSLLVFINLSISLSYTISVSLFLHYCNGSRTVRYELKHTCTHMCRPTSKNTHIQACVHSTHSHANTYTHTHTLIHQASRRANQASGPRSLMFVKVINFLCEIRGHGGRTEGDGCQPQNLSLLSSTGTGTL